MSAGPTPSSVTGGVIDTHVHFWCLEREDPIGVNRRIAGLERDFTPADLAPLCRPLGVERVVLVQAAPAVAESHYLLDLAARDDLVAAVVGWVDLSAADLEAQLETLARRGKFAGVRAMVADVPAPGWLATAPVRHGLAALAARDLTLDLLVRPGQLDDVRGVIEAFPAARINVNHCARPLIVAREWQPWASRLAAVAAAGPVVCKLSGLIERGGFEWTVDHLRPYVEHVLACFGPERVMFASNWPIINLVGTYGRWWDAVQTVLDGIGAEQAARRAIFHDTAARFYRLSPTTSGTPRT